MLFSPSSLITHINVSLYDTIYCTTPFYSVQLTMDDVSSKTCLIKTWTSKTSFGLLRPYIQDVLNEVAGDVLPLVVEAPLLWFQSSSSSRLPDPCHYLRPSVILWDPISQWTVQNGIVNCPECDLPDICLRPVHWQDGQNERNANTTCYGKNSVKYLAAITWNKISDTLRSLSSLSVFKKAVRQLRF